MRILHVSQPVEAGVPQVVVGLVADQLRRGHDVHVACPATPGLGNRVVALGARHHVWDAERAPGRTVPGEVGRLQRVIREVAPDVVVLHSAKAGLAGRLVRFGGPVVYVPHAWSFEAVDGVLGRLSTGWEVVAGRRTAAVVCVSDDERRRGEQAGVGCRMDVIANGVDIVARIPGVRADARRTLGLGDQPTVVCVGRLAEQKGQDRLLAAWPAVRAQLPQAQLLIVGDGPDSPALRAAAPPGVTFFGTRSDVDTFLAAADVVALPSRWESTPLIGLEAMAAGRPIVAFDVDGLRAAFGDTGTILGQDDIAGFADALLAGLVDPARARAAGEAARVRVEQVADLRVALDDWDRLITALISTDPPPVPASASMSVPAARPLRRLPVAGLTAQLAAGAFREVDVAVVDGRRRGDRLRTALLSAIGVPVAWTGRTGSRILGPGAPVVSGPAATDAGALAASVGRPGSDAPRGGPPISVVATMLNEGAALQQLIDDLDPQLGPDDELVLVDGGSDDGSVEALRPHPQLRVLVVPGAGISQGRNIGIEAAAHEVIVCTDVGCVPAPGFLAAFRAAFATQDPPALVSGVYTATARSAMERAQALACYPQPSEVRRRSLLLRLYTGIFGTGYDPRFAVGRCVAFTRDAWKRAGGFPEHLATGEDVSFGLAVARDGVVLAAVDAEVAWHQRDGIAATWRMYRGYGRASTDGGDLALLVRDGARGLAYLLAPVLLASRWGRRVTVLGAAGYLSVPVLRALRADAGPTTVALLPVAMAVKDLGKLSGAVQGLLRRRRRNAR